MTFTLSRILKDFLIFLRSNKNFSSLVDLTNLEDLKLFKNKRILIKECSKQINYFDCSTIEHKFEKSFLKVD